MILEDKKQNESAQLEAAMSSDSLDDEEKLSLGRDSVQDVLKDIRAALSANTKTDKETKAEKQDVAIDKNKISDDSKNVKISSPDTKPIISEAKKTEESKPLENKESIKRKPDDVEDSADEDVVDLTAQHFEQDEKLSGAQDLLHTVDEAINSIEEKTDTPSVQEPIQKDSAHDIQNLTGIVENLNFNMDIYQDSDFASEISSSKTDKSVVTNLFENKISNPISEQEAVPKKSLDYDFSLLTRENAEQLLTEIHEFKNYIASYIKTYEEDKKRSHIRANMTLEDLVLEAIKPELSDWINKNIKSIVTNIVQKEIAELIRGEPSDE